MKVIISPAKKLDFETPCKVETQDKPIFIEKTNKLAKELKTLNPDDISKLMKLSQDLSDLNYKRFQSFKAKYNTTNTKQAAFAFNGDTYTGLDINSFSSKDLDYSQDKLRILSGLYGILKPFDLIQPYRLEMGTKFKFDQYKNLYEYWKEDVTNYLNQELTTEDYLVNCASNEYFSVIDKKQLNPKIITPHFKELKNGEYKMISFFAKKARGMMANYIIKNNINSLEEIKSFDLDGYKFNAELSQKEMEPVFTRSQ